MPRYRIQIDATNLLVDFDGIVAKYGFITFVYCEAGDEQSAGNAAIASVRDRVELESLALNNTDDPPSIDVIEIVQVDSIPTEEPGRVWYDMNPGEAASLVSPFIRRILTPVLCIFMVMPPFLVRDWTQAAISAMVTMEVLMGLMLVGFWCRAKIGHLAFRGIALIIFFTYVTYAAAAFTTANATRTGTSPHPSSPLRAVLGFCAIGLPSFWYAVTGRLTLRKYPALDSERVPYRDVDD